jgi:translation initiation factor IF-3
MKEQLNRINDDLKDVSQIRLVGDNVETGLYDYNKAIKLANNLNLDLVEISKNENESICKIIDYQKFLYQKKKKEKEIKAKAAKVELKEIRLGPQTGKHDYDFKLKHAQHFIEEGNKVKFTIIFEGREIAYKQQGEDLLNSIISDLSETSVVDTGITLIGKRMSLILRPKK